MPTKYLTPAERKERADRNRLARERGELPPQGNGPGAKNPISTMEALGNASKPGTPLHTAIHVLEVLDSVPYFAGGEDLTGEQLKIMCQIIEAGNFPHQVAIAMGIPKHTWDTWMQKGKRHIEPYSTIYNATQQARQRAVLSLTRHLRTAAEVGTWAAAARMLESMSSDEWMRTERVVDETGSKFLEILTRLEEARRRPLPAGTVVETNAVRHSLIDKSDNLSVPQT